MCKSLTTRTQKKNTWLNKEICPIVQLAFYYGTNLYMFEINERKYASQEVYGTGKKK